MAKIEKTRININVPNLLLERIDEYAKKNGINRTVAINLLCQEALSFPDNKDGASENFR